jgi:hypothetical protein
VFGKDDPRYAQASNYSTKAKQAARKMNRFYPTLPTAMDEQHRPVRFDHEQG